MDKLPQDLVFDILSRLDDSADVARCRQAWKIFKTVSPNLQSINLQWPLQRYLESRSGATSSSQFTSPLKTIFLNLVSNLKVLESVHIGADNLPLDVSHTDVEDYGDDLYLTNEGFVKEWLPSVSGDLKSLSISDFWVQSSWRRSELLSLVSAYCHSLLNLELKYTWLSVENVNTMIMLTTLTLEYIKLDDKNLTEFNKCFPNLEVLNLIDVRGLKRPMIHLLNLKKCHWTITDSPSYIMLVTPNLITLRLECTSPGALYVGAPLLSHFHLAVDRLNAFAVKKFQNLKTICLECSNIDSILSKFSSIKTVETLTLETRVSTGGAVGNSKFSLQKLFFVFPNMTSLCFNTRVWPEFYPRYGANWERIQVLKTFRGYMTMVDPSLTFFLVACLLGQCFKLEEVSLLIHRDVAPHVSEHFISQCMTQWPRVNWRWGVWAEGMEDFWIPNE